MPWCESCDRFLSPSTVAVDGTCPVCGRPVDPGHAHGSSETAAHAEVDADVDDGDEPLGPIPWHLKLLAAALALYLGYRAFQGIEWLVHQF